MPGFGMSKNLFSLHAVSFNYPGGNTVFEDVNLEIKPNDLLIIKGESGSGKSTLLKLCNRFCDPTAGDITFHDRDLKEYAIDRIRSSIIYLPQLPFLIDATVEENLVFPFSFHSHKNKKFDTKKAGEWLDYFQLQIPLSHKATQLSIGQKQRIALIRAILLEPEVLLLDEPGSSLDSTNKKLIEGKIEHLVGTSPVTVLMATHSEVSFAGPGLRILNLEDKKIIQELNHEQ
jgi:putative ABC transport system ATP-binding protein